MAQLAANSAPEVNLDDLDDAAVLAQDRAQQIQDLEAARALLCPPAAPPRWSRFASSCCAPRSV